MKQRLPFILVIGLFAIVMSFLVSNHYLGQAEKHLATEDKATASKNRVLLATQEAIHKYELQRQLGADDREFNMRLYGRPDPPPEVVQQQIEQHLRKIAEDEKH
jgi:hypothetical protein